MEEKFTPSPEVGSDITPLPEVVSTSTKKRTGPKSTLPKPEILKTKKTKTAKKRSASAHRRKKIKTKTATITHPTLEAKERNRWIVPVSNLALLIAIFAIIFAAHKAIQKSTRVPVGTERGIALGEKPTQEEVDEMRSMLGKSASDEDKVLTTEEMAATLNENLQADQVVVVEPEKVVGKKSFRDPYTSGGPLDLDRRSLNEPTDISRQISELINPWNGGGALDLDREEKRLEYRKNNYLSMQESDNTAP